MATIGVAPAVAYGAIACGSVLTNDARSVDDASSEVDADPSTDALIDAGPEATSCVPEPEWAGQGSDASTRANCDGLGETDLLVDPNNCGRCGRVCPNTGGGCVAGLCPPITHDVGIGETTLLAVDGKTLFYAAGTDHTQRELRRLDTSTGTAASVATVNVDAQPEPRVYSAAVNGGTLWFRTRTALYRLPKDATDAALPFPLPAGLDDDARSEMAIFGAELLATSPNTNKVIQIDQTSGAASLYVAPAAYASEARAGASRFVWLEQPRAAYATFAYPSALHVRESSGGTYRRYAPDAAIAGLSSDGVEAFVLRLVPNGSDASTGGVVRVDLADGGVTEMASDSISADVVDSLNTYAATAFDATSVYWLHSNASTKYASVRKRSRCGGATVTVAPETSSLMYGASRIAVIDDRVYVSTFDGIVSFLK